MQESSQGAVGKRVADHVYGHVAALGCWPNALRARIEQAAALARVTSGLHFNVVKMHALGEQLSLLAYDDFDDAPFPTLNKSWRINLATGTVVYRDYTDSRNPPILHRKELLLPPDDPRIPSYAALTQIAEALGLFDDPSRIGFREQWLTRIATQGYALQGGEFIPVANVEFDTGMPAAVLAGPVQRHLTALSRANLSAPVQALWRHGLISPERTFFDYGCGKGDDVRTLCANSVDANGWDPHFRPEAELRAADTVNLGFVINVIEDPDERVKALRGAYGCANGVLAVAAMLASQQPPDGRVHGDGYLTSRNTFQKYFTQAQLRDFIEHVLDESAIAVGPGVFFVFKDKGLEQRFLQRRYGARAAHALQGTWLRMARVARVPKPTREREHQPSREEAFIASHQTELHALWLAHVELGRPPVPDELDPDVVERLGAGRAWAKLCRLAMDAFENEPRERAARQKYQDLLVFAALQQFGKRQPYRHLDGSLQRDIRYHFGDYQTLQQTAKSLLLELSRPERLHAACVEASERGLGWLEDSHSLQLHTQLVPKLPALLRIYIACATVLVGDIGDFDLVKIHIRSGKVTLLKYEDFDGTPLPRLLQRVKVKLRELDLDLFDYGSATYPCPLLYFKSRFMNEECAHYPEQVEFEAECEHLGLLTPGADEPSAADFFAKLSARRWEVDGYRLVRSRDTPNLDAPCGRYLTYRQFIECGETQQRTGLSNLPRQPDTYTALHELAVHVLDPVIDYFGMIELTYGFCSAELARVIPGRIDPRLDQHAGHELNRRDKPICERLGAACDFLVTEEDMEEVALWVAANTPFDRLYFYGKDRPIHVSYSATPARQFVRMVTNATGVRIPRIDRSVAIFGVPAA
ncbi:DNA phosphorothioation-associated putative methyltransferase [Massilia sp. NEAU-DD11]|uniref:DNA phosphorothioation-associated putative methyltransferase n=1 Tax=Massilia cellulosiltytica TaxID=2683234 RepID=A0A7X3G5P6_9BURK|nr:DNA phosphorothioation-associated putative methyltransferase [Telluria cellulosilytica]MVW64161.1 DNA phosphorothioation-associated putative methyltransferase [Telluria cellulosilytica]